MRSASLFVTAFNAFCETFHLFVLASAHDTIFGSFRFDSSEFPIETTGMGHRRSRGDSEANGHNHRFCFEHPHSDIIRYLSHF